MSFSDNLNNIQSNITSDGVSRTFRTASILGTLGAGAGLFIAYRKHCRVWGYVGYTFFGAVIGSTLGNVAGMAMDSKES